MDEHSKERFEKLLKSMREKHDAFNELSLEEQVKVLRERNRKLQDHVWALEEQLGNKVVSSETIECDECSEVHTALVLIYENSRTNVICEGDCYDCKYRQNWPI